MARSKKDQEPDPSPERPSQPRTRNPADEVETNPGAVYVGDPDLESNPGPHAEPVHEGDEQ